MSRRYQPISRHVEQLAAAAVDAAFAVHAKLGPGLLESVYHRCLVHELRRRSIKVQTQLAMPIIYDDLRIDDALKIDILVEDELILELKAVDSLLPVHKAQLLTYLKLANKRLGLLINFNVELIRDGIKRVIL